MQVCLYYIYYLNFPVPILSGGMCQKAHTMLGTQCFDFLSFYPLSHFALSPTPERDMEKHLSNQTCSFSQKLRKLSHIHHPSCHIWGVLATCHTIDVVTLDMILTTTDHKASSPLDIFEDHLQNLSSYKCWRF